MRKKSLLLTTLSTVLLIGCSKSIKPVVTPTPSEEPTPTTTSPSEEPTPSVITPSTTPSPSISVSPTPSVVTPQVIDLEISDSNIDTYTTSSVYANDNGLEVILKYDDESTRVAEKNEYTYHVFTSLDTMIDHTMPFENAGDYVVKVFYEELSKQLDFNVKQVEKDGLISFSLNKENIVYDDDEIINVSDCSIVATYRIDGEIVEKHYDYVDFEENNFVLKLFNQDNKEVLFDNPLEKGTYYLRAANIENEELSSEVIITVQEAKHVFSYRFIDKNWSTNIESWTSNIDGFSFSSYQGVQCTTKCQGSATSSITFNRINSITITYSTTSMYGTGTIAMYVGNDLVDEVSVSKTTQNTEIVFTPNETMHGNVTFVVNCTENSIYIYGIEIDTADKLVYPEEIIAENTITMYPEDTHVLEYELLPDNSSYRNVGFISSNPSVAEVRNDGLITAVEVGEADITSYIEGRHNTITAVTHVVVNPILVTGLNLMENDVTIYLGSRHHIKAEVFPNNASNKELIYKSSDESIATVDNDGTIHALELGNTTIEISTKEGGFSDVLRISIVEQPAFEKVNLEQNIHDYGEHNIYELDYCPTYGNPKVLVIPIWFSDSTDFIDYDYRENVRSDIQLAYFGNTEDIGWYSTSSYYFQESFGICNLTGVVSSWYEVGKSYKNYGGENVNMTNLVNKAVNWYFDNTNDDRKSFDTDDDGYIDGVVLIYGCPNSTYFNNYSNLWAYTSWTGNIRNRNNPNACPYFWASYDFLYSYGGVARSRTGLCEAGSGDCHNVVVDTHTLIHEMGHTLGLNDYYDYGDGGYTQAGGFNMQDYNVGGHDPYSVMSYGWANPYIPTESCTIIIEPFQSSHDLILLTPKWNENNSPYDEYMLLELYSPTGLNELDSLYQYRGAYPQGPSTYGIRLWHVDAILATFTYTQYNIDFESFTTDATKNNTMIAYTNSYAGGGRGGYVDYHYSELRLVRNNPETPYLTHSTLSARDLFYEGDSFEFETFSSQFYNETSLDNGLQLGWSFTVEECNEERATITVTKL